MSITTLPFGRTGHDSSRIIFGAAALSRVSQDVADRTLDTLLAHGINHIDVAASYGDAELRVAPWLKRYPNHFFLATKTGERRAAPAREELQRSLDRLGVDHVDLWQHGAEENRSPAMQHQQRRERLDIEVAERVCFVFDVDPEMKFVHRPGRSSRK